MDAVLPIVIISSCSLSLLALGLVLLSDLCIYCSSNKHVLLCISLYLNVQWASRSLFAVLLIEKLLRMILSTGLGMDFLAHHLQLLWYVVIRFAHTLGDMPLLRFSFIYVSAPIVCVVEILKMIYIIQKLASYQSNFWA